MRSPRWGSHDGHGSQRVRPAKGSSALYRGAEYTVDFLPKVKVQVLVTDAKAAAQVVDAIVHGAHTGKIGDGKILVTAVEEIIRIRSGEKGADAI